MKEGSFFPSPSLEEEGEGKKLTNYLISNCGET
jgi:hypothetical protein